jgi:hypothetical protein
MNQLNALIRDIPMPPRIKRLPISDRGFPIPWFTHIEDDGTPNFTAIARGRLSEAFHHRKCWICGDHLGTYYSFVLGPMCCVNRINSEPPSHLDCALYAAKACPFLVNPRAKRNYKALPADTMEAAGVMIERNPGVTGVYTTRDFKPMRVHNGILFRLGEPEHVTWWCEGRPATRAEVTHSIETGLPLLRAECEKDSDPKDSHLALDRCIARAQRLYPAEPPQ